ncbi:multiple organellar RNA editing factor 6, mitochondrial-like [Brassica napus]|nr:multiple organellar RNA editing factor 6, mitochondrial-like [Brassica napus]
MANTLSRSTASRVANRFFSTSKSLAPSPSNLISHRSSQTLFHAVGFNPSSSTLDDILQTQKIRPRVVHRSSERHSPRKSRSKFSCRPPTTEISPLPSGCDYKHWLIVIDKPGGEYASKEQMIGCYVQTLAKIVGSKEEAKRNIYNVSCEKYFAFGCEIDEETSNRLKGIPGVRYVLPDSYVDPEYKDYGGELFLNGEVVPRPPERQRRIVRFMTPILRYNDRTRNVRGRESML